MQRQSVGASFIQIHRIPFRLSPLYCRKTDSALPNHSERPSSSFIGFHSGHVPLGHLNAGSGHPTDAILLTLSSQALQSAFAPQIPPRPLATDFRTAIKCGGSVQPSGGGCSIALVLKGSGSQVWPDRSPTWFLDAMEGRSVRADALG
jgi:hypothetical protein